MITNAPNIVNNSTEELSITRCLSVIWCYRFFIAIVVVIALIASVGISLEMTKYYKAEAVILPHAQNNSAIQTLAAVAGFSTMEGDENYSQLYPEILRSKNILKKVVLKKYKTDKFSNPVNLIEYWYAGENKGLAELFEMAIKKIRRENLVIEVDNHTGIITMSVIVEEPILAADISNELIEELDNYNREFRKIKAKEQRLFIEERLIEEKVELNKAENKLTSFRENNRRVIDSPSLLLEQERLIREVELHNALFIELSKQFELAKIEEVKNMPVIDVLDRAEPPTKRFKPQRKRIVITLFILSLSCAILLAFIGDYYKRNRERYFKKQK